MPFLAPAIAAVAGAISAVAGAVGGAVATAVFTLGGSAALASTAGEIALEAVPSIIEFGALAGASALLTPKPKVNTSGSPQAFKADPNAPIPVVMGRYGVGGNLVYETVSGGSNKAEHGAQGNEYLTHFTILSGNGPIEGVETLRFDDTILTFSGETCSGGYIPQVEVQAYNPGYTQTGDGSYANNVFANHAWQTYTYGGIPSPSFGPPTKLAADNGALTEWTGKGFSGFAASALTIVYDQTVYSGGVPQRQWVLKGVHRYDPRKDNNYPGGAGDQYWAGAGAAHDYLLTARSSWTWSENPAIHALGFALGDFLPDGVTGLGRPYLGIGAGGPGVAGLLGGVDVAAFVHAANVADANGWKICGQWTSADGKWSVLTAMLQAGGAVPNYDRGRISCMVSEPRTSLGTVTANDLAGDITLDTGTSLRERPNTIFYSYSSEAHRWQVVQADTPISPATYVAQDGGVRVGNPLVLEYVPSVDQAAQLTAYAIADGREIPNIQVIGKPHLRAYAVGDCFTLDIPEAGLATTKVVVTKRTTSLSTGQVTLICRTETDAKHAYALGRSGVAPPTPGISGVDPSIVPAPIPAAWTAVPTTLTDTATGAITHVIRINGSTIDNVFAADVIVDYAPVTTVGGVDTLGTVQHQSFAASVEQIDLNLPAGRYHVWIRYRTATGAENPENQLDLGVITVAADTAATAVTAGSVGSYTPSDIGTLETNVGNAIAAASAAAATGNQAVSIATTQAGYGAGAINRNANFGDYPDADVNSYPGAAGGGGHGWFDSLYAWRNVSRQPGKDSPYAYVVDTSLPGGGPSGLASNCDTSGGAFSPGQYLLEAHVTLESGSLAHSGLHVDIHTANPGSGGTFITSGDLSFTTDQDATASVIGAGVVGRDYRFSKLVDLTASGGAWFTLYLQNAARDGNTNGEGRIRWHRAALVPASALAAVKNVATAAASQAAAAASDVETVSAKVTTNPNLIPNGGLENGFSGWGGVNAYWSLITDGYWGRYAQTPIYSGHGAVELVSEPFPVVAGRQLTLAADVGLVGNVEAGDYAYIDMYVWPVLADAQSRNYAATGTYDGPQNALGTAQDFSDDDTCRSRTAVTFTPTVTGWGVVRVIADSSAPAGNPAYVRYRLGKCEPGAVMTPYTAEGTNQDLSASVTVTEGAVADAQSKLAAAYFSVVAAAAGANPAYVKLASSTLGGFLALVADRVVLGSADGSSIVTALELVGGKAFFSQPIYISAAGGRLILGPAFGVSGDLLLWYGAESIDHTTATKANAQAYFSIDGFIAGPALPGTAQASGSYAATANSVPAVVALSSPLTVKNGQVTVVASINVNQTTQPAHAAGRSAYNSSINVQLQRSDNGGAWYNVGGAVQLTGYISYDPSAGESGEDLWAGTITGSLTIPDSAMSGGTQNYRLSIDDGGIGAAPVKSTSFSLIATNNRG